MPESGPRCVPIPSSSIWLKPPTPTLANGDENLFKDVAPQRVDGIDLLGRYIPCSTNPNRGCQTAGNDVGRFEGGRNGNQREKIHFETNPSSRTFGFLGGPQARIAVSPPGKLKII